MITGRRLFVSSAVFGIAIAVVYWFSSHSPDGTILLGLMATALVFAAGYMFIAEREARLVGDRSNASNADASGERLGVFTVASPWPIAVAFGAFLLLLGLAIFPVLAVFGLVLLLFGLLCLGRESSLRSAPTEGARASEMLALWGAAKRVLETERTRLADDEIAVERARSTYARANEAATQADSELAELKLERHVLLRKLAEICTQNASQIASGEWGTSLVERGHQMQMLQEKAKRRAQDPLKGNWFSKLVQGISRFANDSNNAVTVWRYAQECAQLLARPGNGSASPDPIAKRLVTEIAGVDANIVRAIANAVNLRSHEASLKSELQSAQRTVLRRRTAVKSAEGRYWGLRDSP